MSSSSPAFPKPPRGPDVLGELLHSLSQPLTGLRCSLELSLVSSPESSVGLSVGDVAERQQESVSIALQQTEIVIGMIQLMREYLDAEQPQEETCPVALAPVIRSVIEEFTSITAVRGIHLRLVGTCAAEVRVPESRLRLALQYLISTMVEAQASGSTVTLLLGEGPAGTALRGEGECRRDDNYREPNSSFPGNDSNLHAMKQRTTRRNPDGDASSSISTLGRARLAIASRAFEAAGASLVFGGEGKFNGFVLRIPRRI